LLICPSGGVEGSQDGFRKSSAHPTHLASATVRLTRARVACSAANVACATAGAVFDASVLPDCIAAEKRPKVRFRTSHVRFGTNAFAEPRLYLWQDQRRCFLLADRAGLSLACRQAEVVFHLSME
jgi:hypothetical protein